MEDFSVLYWPGDTTKSLRVGQTPIFGDALLVTWSVKKGCIMFEAIAVLRGLYHPGEGKEPLFFSFLVCDEEAYYLFFQRYFSRGQTHEAPGRFRIVRARSASPTTTKHVVSSGILHIPLETISLRLVVR